MNVDSQKWTAGLSTRQNSPFKDSCNATLTVVSHHRVNGRLQQHLQLLPLRHKDFDLNLKHGQLEGGCSALAPARRPKEEEVWVCQVRVGQELQLISVLWWVVRSRRFHCRNEVASQI